MFSWQIYEPLPYLKRTFRHFDDEWLAKGVKRQDYLPKELRLVAICWRQGVSALYPVFGSGGIW